MNRIVDQLHIFSYLRFVVLFMVILFLHGCAGIFGLQERPGFYPTRMEDRIEKNRFPVPRGDDVVGRLAVIKLEKGDTLPDVARHFSLGINAISAANPGVDVWVPEAGERILLPLSFILPDAPRKGIVINLATMRLFQFKEDGSLLTVSTYPVGVGTEERPTPIGQAYIERKASRPTWHVPASIAEDHRKKGDPLPAEVPPGPLNPLGEYAMYLSKSSYLIHGTNKPASIGLRATNGCMRLYPEDIMKLYANTPVKTPVAIVNQPYLTGLRNGVVYLEAHTPFEGSGNVELDKMYLNLKKIEKKTGRTMDWKKVNEVLTEAKGFPVPILEDRQGSLREAMEMIEVKYPVRLNGKPEVPAMKIDAWYILAADKVRDKTEALRLAAIINHQGPQIPARALPKNDYYRVMAGPFDDIREAKDAAKRLKIDLEIDGILVEPTKKK